MLRQARQRSQAGPGKQSGQGKIGCVLWILAFAIAGTVAFKMIPVKVKTSELHTFMVDQAKWAQHQTADNLKKSILAKARDLGLPLDEKGVEVVKSRDRVRMEAVYTVPVVFPGYTYYWQFHDLVDRNIYIF